MNTAKEIVAAAGSITPAKRDEMVEAIERLVDQAFKDGMGLGTPATAMTAPSSSEREEMVKRADAFWQSYSDETRPNAMADFALSEIQRCKAGMEARNAICPERGELSLTAREDVASKADTIPAPPSPEEVEALAKELMDDAAMNEEIPVKTHLHKTARLERLAADTLLRVARHALSARSAAGEPSFEEVERACDVAWSTVPMYSREAGLRAVMALYAGRVSPSVAKVVDALRVLANDHEFGAPGTFRQEHLKQARAALRAFENSPEAPRNDSEAPKGSQPIERDTFDAPSTASEEGERWKYLNEKLRLLESRIVVEEQCSDAVTRRIDAHDERIAMLKDRLDTLEERVSLQGATRALEEFTTDPTCECGHAVSMHPDGRIGKRRIDGAWSCLDPFCRCTRTQASFAEKGREQ